MSKEKTYYFKVEGRVTASEEWVAKDYLYHLLKGKCERFIIREIEEIES